ncbi:MAG TPA: alpha/beta hydrolase [Anaerolineales bacterium]|nr:alpha/beta hydrolase [Anaerolineales bacterium]
MKNRRYWRNLVLMLAFSLLLAFFIFLVFVSDQWAQARLHPARVIPNDDLLVENGIPFQEIELNTKDGVTLSAWYTPPKNGAVILVAHGYNSSREAAWHLLFAKHGYGVLSFDFRAHGLSGGEVSTLGYFEQADVEAALEYALSQPEVEHVGAWGGSMGAVTVLLAAADRVEIEAVVSDSAFPTLEDVLAINVPFGLMKPFVMFFGEYRSGVDMDLVRPVDDIARISPRPVFLIDGWEGGTIIMNSPYRLYDAAREPKQIWVEDGVPHLAMHAYFPEDYENRVVGFFDEYLLAH